MNRRQFDISLGEISVGELVESDGDTTFRFHDAYLDQPLRPVLGQDFEDDLRRVYRSRRFGLPAFFANLVPEPGRLRDVICSATAIEADDDLGLLEFTGSDLPGAVTVRASAPSRTNLTGKLSRSAESPAGRDESKAERLRFSLAGVQMKFSMLLADEKLTLPGRGATGELVVKFPSPVFADLPENEFSMLSWARATGFDVPPCTLQSVSVLDGFPRRFAVDGESVLAIERYDRNGDRRIHQEDFAQVVGLPPSKKYDQITFDALVSLAKTILGDSGADEALRRLALVIATGNNDAHLKNWSLIYPDAVQAAWAPLYDQVSTVAWSGESSSLARALALKLGAVKNFGQIDRGAFERLAQKVGLAEERVARIVRDTIAHLREIWMAESDSWPLVTEHREALVDHWTRVPLLREIGPLR